MDAWEAGGMTTRVNAAPLELPRTRRACYDAAAGGPTSGRSRHGGRFASALARSAGHRAPGPTHPLRGGPTDQGRVHRDAARAGLAHRAIYQPRTVRLRGRAGATAAGAVGSPGRGRALEAIAGGQSRALWTRAATTPGQVRL